MADASGIQPRRKITYNRKQSLCKKAVKLDKMAGKSFRAVLIFHDEKNNKMFHFDTRNNFHEFVTTTYKNFTGENIDFNEKIPTEDAMEGEAQESEGEGVPDKEMAAPEEVVVPPPPIDPIALLLSDLGAPVDTAGPSAAADSATSQSPSAGSSGVRYTATLGGKRVKVNIVRKKK